MIWEIWYVMCIHVSYDMYDVCVNKSELIEMYWNDFKVDEWINTDIATLLLSWVTPCCCEAWEFLSQDLAREAFDARWVGYVGYVFLPCSLKPSTHQALIALADAGWPRAPYSIMTSMFLRNIIREDHVKTIKEERWTSVNHWHVYFR